GRHPAVVGLRATGRVDRPSAGPRGPALRPRTAVVGRHLCPVARGHRGRRPGPPGYRPGTRPDPGTRPAPGADGRPAAEAVPPCCLGPGTDPGDGDRVRPDGVAHEPGHRGPGRSGLRTRRPPPLRQCRTEPRPARGPAAAVVVGTLPAPDVVVAGG